MRVKVEMIIETEDFGEEEFQTEIERLITDIDSDSRLIEFVMYDVNSKAKLYRPPGDNKSLQMT